MIAGAFVVFWFDPSGEKFFPVCPLYRFTGFACSGCGMTRAFHALLHGDILGALRFNLFMPVMLLFLSYIFLSLFIYAIKGRAPSVNIVPQRYLWVLFTLMLVFGVLRNIPIYPFNVFFP